MAASKRHPGSRRERGAVIVEMALALPLLLLIVAGVVDLGLLFWEKEVLTNAAREGARAGVKSKLSGTAVVAEKTQTEVRTLVQTYLQNLNIKDAAGAPITLTSGNCLYQRDTSTTPAMLTVRLQNIPVKMMLLPNILTFFGGGGIDNIVYLDAKSTMASEW